MRNPAYARVAQVPITIAIAAGCDRVLHGRVKRPALTMPAFSPAVLVVMLAMLALWFV